MRDKPAEIVDMQPYLTTKRRLDDILEAGEMGSKDRELYKEMIIQITRKRLGLQYDGQYVIDEEGE